MTQLIYNIPEILSRISNWIDQNKTQILIAVIAGLIILLIQQIINHRKKNNEKAAKKEEEDIKTQTWRKRRLGTLPNDFDGYYPNEKYIQPYFTFIDKAKGKRGKQLLKDYFLNKVFIEGTKEPRLFCLLGDTGTGKTAALANLYADYINSHTEDDLPYPIEILSMRNPDIFENITKITNKHCILLLDAMDENPLAQDLNQLNLFNENLNKICQDFDFVIITCRPQFFPDDDSISNQVKVHKGEHWIHYTRLKLSEFDDNQVHEYLGKVFSPAEQNLLLKAEEITNKHPLITIRPLILEHIRPIVESNREINTTLDIYDTIVQNWIQRELKKKDLPDNIDKITQQWWNKTSQIAGYIYQKTSGTSKELSITIG